MASVESGEDDLRGVDPWAQRHLTELVALEAVSPDATTGTTLLHTDLRADNILLTPSRVYFVDWPWASRGAPWVDLAFMLPSIAMQRGPKPWEIVDNHPLGRTAPGLPTVRAFQRDQGVPALEWLKRASGWT